MIKANCIPCQMIHNIPQPTFEELVSKRLAKNNLVEIRKNHSFVRVEEVRRKLRIF